VPLIHVPFLSKPLAFLVLENAWWSGWDCGFFFFFFFEVLGLELREFTLARQPLH
jgi:hypothetical protein